MSGYLNEASIIGNLTRDVEVRATQSGQEIGNLSIATNESWNDKSTGEKKESVEYHRVTIFNEKLLKAVQPYLTKGTKVFVRGKLTTRKWTNKEGQEQYSTEITLQNFNGTLILLGGKSDNAGGSAHYQAKADGYQSQDIELSDQIPF